MSRCDRPNGRLCSSARRPPVGRTRPAAIESHLRRRGGALMVTGSAAETIAALLPEVLKLPLGLPRDLGPAVTVPLTKEHVALISPEDEGRVGEFHWHAKFNRS